MMTKTPIHHGTLRRLRAAALGALIVLLAMPLSAADAEPDAAADLPPGVTADALPDTVDTADTADTADTETAGGALIVQGPDTTLDAWQWTKRPVVVFADSPADPRFVEQMEILSARFDALDQRDVVIIADTDPRARSAVRQKLRPRGFMLVVMAKDGTIVTRKPRPWSVREISRSIDKLPLRQQEIRDE